MYLGYWQLHRLEWKTELLSTIKDGQIEDYIEYPFEIRNNDVEESILTIKNIMENNHLQYKNFNVPLTIDYGVGDNWGESH